jgi:hypothetical protein
MPAANVQITSLDFDQIKSSLLAYLRADSTFTDYNFAGSGLNTLVDLLTANTHYQAFYANMLANEGFLDTAVKRSSVVSRAKELGYTPRSTIGATALVNIQALLGGNSPPAGVYLPARTVFGSAGLNQSSGFSFYNDSSMVATADGGGQYWFRNVTIKEGSPNRSRFLVNTSNVDQKFILPNIKIDTSTLRVSVQASTTDTTTIVFTPALNYTTITGIDPVYFLQEVDGELFEIYFGDGNIGLPLDNNNIVICEYMVVAGETANGLSTFSIPGALLATDSGNTFRTRVDTISDSAGGSAIESVDSVRFYAPKAWTSQNRLVTKDDYEHYLLNNVPNVESVSVWGGEDNLPPIYGKVFISLKPNSGYVFSDVAKGNIETNLLKIKSLVSIIPTFLDPEYIHVGVVSEVNYRGTVTNKTDNAIALVATDTIRAYFTNNLERFNANFYFSQLVASIDLSDPAIISNNTQVTLQKRLVPSLFRTIGYTVAFTPNKIHPSKLVTSWFSCVLGGHQYDTVQFKDVPDIENFSTSYEGSGTLQLCDSSNNIILTNVGTINYATGVIKIEPIEFIGVDSNDNTIRFTVYLQEDSLDVETVRNNIVVLDDTAADPLAGIFNNGLIVSAIRV